MLTTRDWIDQVRAKTATGSDYAVAKRLAISESAINAYRLGVRIMDNETARRIAEALDKPLEELIACAEIERAQRAGDKARAEAWKKRLKAFGQSVVAAACAYLMAAASPVGERDERALTGVTEPAPWSALDGGRAAASIDALTIIRSTARRAWGALGTWLRSVVALTPPLALTPP
jgi:transcriptional regulator with XRE-family HTH domain